MKSHFIVCLKYLFAWLSFNKCRQKYFQLDCRRVCCRTAVNSRSCRVSFTVAFRIIIDCCLSYFFISETAMFTRIIVQMFACFFRDSIKSDSSESWKRLEWLFRHDRVDQGLPGQDPRVTPLTDARRYREWLVFIVLTSVSFVRSLKSRRDWLLLRN